MSKEEPVPGTEPSQEDIEEKVRQMLDPSIPDEPARTPNVEVSLDEPVKIEVTKTPTPKAEPVVTGVSVPIAGSAPELPSQEEVPANKKPKGKKKSIAITDHDEPPIEISKDKSDDVPDSKVKKITIADHNESASDLADKLDKTIAELDDTAEPAEDKLAEISDESGSEKLDELVEETSEEQPNTPAETEDAEPEIEIDDPAVIDDPATEKAVAEIVAQESDVLLEVEDALKDDDEPVKEEEKAKPKQKGGLKKWLKKPAVRKSLLALVFLGVTAAGIFPTSRYLILNTAGIRANSSLIILDESTGQPLKDALVSVGAVRGVTDAEGKVTLNRVNLGANNLTIEKRAFAPVAKTVVIGWGSNPLGDVRLRPTGTQFTFKVTDFLSGKPLAKLEASSKDSSAISDDKGVIKLTIDKPGDQPFAVNIKGEGVRTQSVEVDPNKNDYEVKFVPARKHLFISKRSGKYDIYSAYVDGKDEKVILAGNGFERDDIVLVQHPSDNIAAYTSTRGNQHNSEGLLLSNLLIVDTETGETTNVATSERVQLINWSGEYLVYVQIAPGASSESPERFRLMSYNYKTDTNKELAKSNYFNDVVAVGHVIYYAPSSAYQSGQTAFYKIHADGSGQQTILNQEVWNVLRTSYDHLTLSVQHQWYDYHIGDNAPTKLNAAPADQTPRIYANAQDGARSARVENRDGKGTLLVYDTQTKLENALVAENGITHPMHWLNNKVLVYRLKTNQETADYAIHIDGGKPIKIKDVTPSSGLDKWYAY